MKTFFSKFFSVCLYIIFAVLIIFVANSLLGIAQKKVPSYFGYSVLKVLTNSMADEIKAGDYIFIKKVPADQLKVSDIITFYSSDPLIKDMPNTHRIVEIKEKAFITKGDANSLKDNYEVNFDRVIGKYQGKLRIGIFGNLFENKWLLLIVVIIPVGILIIFEAIKLFQSKPVQKD